MSSSTPSDILQNDAKVLEKQQQEIQRRYEEEEQLLIQLEEVAKLHQAEYVAQKARKKAETKVREEVKRRRVAEEEEKKKKMLEYFQQLWNKMLKEEAALLEDVERSYVIGFKCKEITSGDKKGHQPSKKAKEK